MKKSFKKTKLKKPMSQKVNSNETSVEIQTNISSTAFNGNNDNNGKFKHDFIVRLSCQKLNWLL